MVQNSAPYVLTGFGAFCAMMVQNPVVNFTLMVIFLLTCFTVLTHIGVSCWKANRKERKRNGSIAKKHTSQ